MDVHEDLVALAIGQLAHGGAFLMTGKEEKNPMTIGWCQFGRLWNRQSCTVFVRHSRYSYPLMERDGVFTVSFPLDGALKKELAYCGTRSGRDGNKREALGLDTIKSRTNGVDALAGCSIHFECRVLFKLEMGGHLDELDPTVRNQFYSPEQEEGDDGNPHAIYYAEILEAYRT